MAENHTNCSLSKCSYGDVLKSIMFEIWKNDSSNNYHRNICDDGLPHRSYDSNKWQKETREST